MEVAPSALARHAPGNLGLICAPSTRIVNRYEALALKFEPTSPVNNRRGGGALFRKTNLVEAPGGLRNRAGCRKPLYGAFSVKLFFDALCCFFVWPGRCFFFPACGIPMTPRAGVVEVGRRNEVEARSAFPYPHLDGAEHGVRLRAARGAEDAGVVLRDPARSKAVTALALAQIVSLHLWRRGTNTTTNRGEPALRARDCAATLYSVGPCGAAP